MLLQLICSQDNIVVGTNDESEDEENDENEDWKSYSYPLSFDSTLHDTYANAQVY